MGGWSSSNSAAVGTPIYSTNFNGITLYTTYNPSVNDGIGGSLASENIYGVSRYGTGNSFTQQFRIQVGAARMDVGSGFIYSWTAVAGDATGTRDTGIKRNAAGVVEINTGTAGALADLLLKNVRTNPTTVASLTAAATAGAGARSFVTDATTPTFGATVVGGGAVSTPVYSDGANWKVG